MEYKAKNNQPKAYQCSHTGNIREAQGSRCY